MSDLLAELKAERKRLYGRHPIICLPGTACLPCKLSRALDGMIAGLTMCRVEDARAPFSATAQLARQTENAMARAYRGDDAE